MAAIYHNGDWYGLGSDVVANPQDSATDTLTKVGIDGTVYDLSGGIPASEKGAANGVAELDANGLVPSSQLPSYVDDVLEYASASAFPATGETGKIYVALDTNLTYRWSGSAYVEISPSLALGETSSTAYRGDRGKTAYDHATESGRSGAKSVGLYKIGVTAQGHIASATAVAKSDLTALGLADQNDVDAIEEDIEGYKTVTGKYITISDGAELPAKNYSITISPVQEGSGDPSPSNVRPIHGADEVGVYDDPKYAGKIIFNQLLSPKSTTEEAKGLIFTHNGSGKITITGQTTGKGSAISFPVQNVQNNKYLLLTNSSPSNGVVALSSQTYGADTTNNGVIIENQSGNATWYYTISVEAEIGTNINNLVIEPEIFNLTKMFGAGNEPTSVEEFKALFPKEYYSYNTGEETLVSEVNGDPYTSTTITLPSTVYGGSVEMGGSGESKYRFKTFDGTEDWSWYAPSNSVLLSNGIDYRKGAGETIRVPGLCNMVETGSLTGLLDTYIQAGSISGYTLQIVQIGQHFNIENSVDAWKAFLQENNMQLCYEVATPTSLSVTPFPQTLLEGVNNVWAEMVENSTVIDNAQQSLSYQPQNIVGELRQEIEAKPDSFAQLSDTSFSNLANGQIPKWNSTSGKWENANESGGGGASSLADLSDTNISSPADGQILKWDGTSSKWVNANEYSYTLPAADANTLGGIKVGSRLSIDANGVLSANDQSYTLPTASASTKGGIKVGDNLAMNGEVLSAKTVPWTKVWNKNSGATFTFPSDKTEILLVIKSVTFIISTLASAVYAVDSGQPSYMVAADGLFNGTISLYFTVPTSGQPSVMNNTGSTTTNFDFEVWAR